MMTMYKPVTYVHRTPVFGAGADESDSSSSESDDSSDSSDTSSGLWKCRAWQALFRLWGLGFGVYGLRLMVWVVGFRV